MVHDLQVIIFLIHLIMLILHVNGVVNQGNIQPKYAGNQDAKNVAQALQNMRQLTVLMEMVDSNIKPATGIIAGTPSSTHFGYSMSVIQLYVSS